MILSTLKVQTDNRNVRENLLKISSHTHPKHSKPYIFILQNSNKPPDVFCTHLFFSSSTILIFGGLFLHRLSSIFKVSIKCIRVPTTYFARKSRTRRDNIN